MLKIRLSRHGKKRQPSYRVVVSESKFKRDGRYVERLGWFNPLTDPETYLINEGRALYWLSVGAQPTEAVKRLLKKQGTLDRLARVHTGETIEALVAEYEGVDLTAQVAEKVEEAQEAVAEVAAEAEEVAEDVAETVAEQAEEGQGVVAEAIESVQETAGNVAEAVQDGLETAQEAVADVVEQVSELITGSDEDEAEVAEEKNDAEVAKEEKVA